MKSTRVWLVSYFTFNRQIYFEVFWPIVYLVSLQPSLLAMALLCYEADVQHDPEHSDKVAEVLESLQKQLNVRAFFNTFLCSDILLAIVDFTCKHLQPSWFKQAQLCTFNTPPSVASSVQIRDGDLVCVRELVGKCLAEYATSKCSRPNSRRLRWIISGRTARHLKHSYYKITHLPTIPESAF